MLHDASRLVMTRDESEYVDYAKTLTKTQILALSTIGMENSKFLMGEYIERLKAGTDPLIFTTDFMSWLREAMVIYDANKYFEERDKEIQQIMDGTYEDGESKTS